MAVEIRKKICGFNGFKFHYEMFGYIIDYCKKRDYCLTIYSFMDGDSCKYIEFYRKLFAGYENLQFKNLWQDFEREINTFDAVVLFTDDDREYAVYDPSILVRTLCIEHCLVKRRTDIPHCLATRPYDFMRFHETCIVFRENFSPSKPDCLTQSSSVWALPTYPIVGAATKCYLDKWEGSGNLQSNTVNICILGGGSCPSGYNLNILSRLSLDFRGCSTTDARMETKYPKCYDCFTKILLTVITNCLSPESRENLEALNEKKFEVEVHQNLDMESAIQKVAAADYVLTDVANGSETENFLMSGSIPISFSLLVPLIISKQTNRQYKFSNCIEFDMNSFSPIYVGHPRSQQIAINVEKERTRIIEKNTQMLDYHFEQIFSESK